MLENSIVNTAVVSLQGSVQLRSALPAVLTMLVSNNSWPTYLERKTNHINPTMLFCASSPAMLQESKGMQLFKLTWHDHTKRRVYTVK